jgi:hypothetical protein
MTVSAPDDWRQDFGIDERTPPGLFTSKDQLTRTTPQAHLIRRAFDVLKLDAVLCTDHSPLVYFKLLKRFSPDAVYDLHKQFWNHGGAPVLVLVTDDEVHVYSGMTRPKARASGNTDLPALVTTLGRVATGLREFLIAVESGEFFRQHQRSFNPAQRVDRDLLDNLTDARELLDGASRRRIPDAVLDALLCRLVFTCYLFDRQVIGDSYLQSLDIRNASHLRDVLNIEPRSEAKAALYRLFRKLGDDFNGDLFSDNLDTEAEYVQSQHISILNDFFHGTTVRTKQTAFWPYDFGYIPIETISAIYERFLKVSEEQTGAFYTPRFLAEVVLDTALEHYPSLIGKRFFDPACGSGIFLVGLFNRIAEEWKQANPAARNDRKAKELMRLLRDSLYGVDISGTACRITAFSLYLAYLDQLSPRDIQALQEKGRALPRLIVADAPAAHEAGIIRHADFFGEDGRFPAGVTLVIGNPPWGSTADDNTSAGRWCAAHDKPLPDKQIAAAFIWKAAEHASRDGRICLVLPHGVLFNHSTTAVPFQRSWVSGHAIDRVLNLADFQRFLFETAGHPALVVSYRRSPPELSHRIEYWAPKADWTVTKAEVITVAPQDRTSFTVGEVLQDLDGPDAPQIWKQRYWATPRDWRLLDRLSLYPRLRDHTRQIKEKASAKRWIIAQGFQPLGPGDDQADAKPVTLPTDLFLAADSPALDLVLLDRDCIRLPSRTVQARRGRSADSLLVFKSPHVLVSKGFTSIAFAGIHVAFRHAIRGIHGPEADRSLLAFLAAYLRTKLARYFLFHTSSNWGISRSEVQDEELLRLPFPLPDQQPDPARAWQIINEVSRFVTVAATRADADLVDREGIVRAASASIEPLVEEYFDVLPLEKLLIEDTVNIIIDSARPTRARPLVPTLKPSTREQRDAYCTRVCDLLNGLARGGRYRVQGQATGSDALGVGLVMLEKANGKITPAVTPALDDGLLNSLEAVRQAIPRRHATLDLVRGVMVFDRTRLYVVKPIGQRYWTQTAALNDADQIAGTILMQSRKEHA